MSPRILKLHHPTGHPYWQKDEFKVELPDGQMINPYDHIRDRFGGYRLYHDKVGVWAQYCCASSGSGKYDHTGVPPVLLVNVSAYDKIEYVGQPLVMSNELTNDLSENKMKI